MLAILIAVAVVLVLLLIYTAIEYGASPELNTSATILVIYAVICIFVVVPMMEQSDSGPQSGEVTKHLHRTSGCTTNMIPVPNGNGAPRTVPSTSCWPESWKLQLRNCDGGDCALGDVPAKPSVFAQCPVGSRYPECTKKEEAAR